jgi:uncharacterized protein (DUF58 family)
MNLNRITILLLIVAILLRSELFFVLLYIIVGIQVLTRLWLRYEIQSLAWKRSAPSVAFPGERLQVQIELQNRGLLPIPWVSFHESLPTALRTPPMVREVLSLSPGETRTFTYEIASRRRGYFQLGPLHLHTGDVLGLGERPLVSEERSELTIYPPILPLAELGLPASLPYGTLASHQRLFEDPARPAGVRQYQAADGVRRIDWKASAHLGEPMVRRQQPAIALETMVALAFSQEEYHQRFAYDSMERAITAAASILGHLSQQRQAFGLCSTGIDPAAAATAPTIPIGTSKAHLMVALGVLGRLEPNPHGSILDILRTTTAGLGWGSSLVIISGQPVEQLLPDAIALRKRGLNITFVLTEHIPAELTLARKHGVVAYALARDGRVELM